MDACPETGLMGCQYCSGEACARHGFAPCDCAVDERHHPPATSTERVRSALEDLPTDLLDGLRRAGRNAR